MGFTPSLLKKKDDNAVLLWCKLQAGPPSLHYYCTVRLHSCIVLPPVGHSSNYECHCCQLPSQSSCVSNFIALLRFSFDSPLYMLVENLMEEYMHQYFTSYQLTVGLHLQSPTIQKFFKKKLCTLKLEPQ